MAKFYNAISDDLRDFIHRQPVYFTASATDTSRINLSPRGRDTLRVLDNRTVAYLDLTGSGNETAAHLKADGRLTIMLCSFDEKPLIMRLYGRGRLVFPRDGEWNSLAALFPQHVGARQIVVLDVESLQTSCGFGVPVAESMQPRDKILQWCESKGEEGLAEYRRRNNRISIDGLPSDTVAPEAIGQHA